MDPVALDMEGRTRSGALAKSCSAPRGARARANRNLFGLPPARGELTDETQHGSAAIVTLIDGQRPPEFIKSAKPEELAKGLGLPSHSEESEEWDVFEAVLTPGDIILMVSSEGVVSVAGVRLRRVRVIRDYGMYDRREAPQY